MSTVEIKKLHLRVPGLSREEARCAGEEIAQRVSLGLPAYGKKQRLGAVNLRVKLPVGTPRDQVAKLIAIAILEKLG